MHFLAIGSFKSFAKNACCVVHIVGCEGVANLPGIARANIPPVSDFLCHKPQLVLHGVRPPSQPILIGRPHTVFHLNQTAARPSLMLSLINIETAARFDSNVAHDGSRACSGKKGTCMKVDL